MATDGSVVPLTLNVERRRVHRGADGAGAERLFRRRGVSWNLPRQERIAARADRIRLRITGAGKRGLAITGVRVYVPPPPPPPPTPPPAPQDTR